MAKIVSSNAILGNLILNCAVHNKCSISLNEIFVYRSALDKQANAGKYFITFNFADIEDFANEYCFFVNMDADGNLHLKNKPDQGLIRRLKRYFEMGLPSDLVVRFEVAAKKIVA